MEVFIENEAGSDQKNIYNEKTQEYIKTVTVSRGYPYPYGFIVGTTSGDGDNLDCFVITNHKLNSGEIVEVEPVGVMEQIDNGEEDHNILAIFPDEPRNIDDRTKEELTDFISHVFDHREDKAVRPGQFLNKDAATKLIKGCLDDSSKKNRTSTSPA